MKSAFNVHASTQPAPPVDELTFALDHFRPKLDRSLPILQRAENFWRIVVSVRDLAAADVLREELIAFARRSGLTKDLGRRGAEDIEHLIRWGCLRRWPFGGRRGTA
jgi:hypothetical protein